MTSIAALNRTKTTLSVYVLQELDVHHPHINLTIIPPLHMSLLSAATDVSLLKKTRLEQRLAEHLIRFDHRTHVQVKVLECRVEFLLLRRSLLRELISRFRHATLPQHTGKERFYDDLLMCFYYLGLI